MDMFVLTGAEEDKLYDDALAIWGGESQINQCGEECGELIAALNRWRRGTGSINDAAGEVADVLVMAGQMRKLCGAEKVDAIKQQKLFRLRERLADAGKRSN